MSMFDYLNPTDEQKQTMKTAREGAKLYYDLLAVLLPDGADKTYTLRKLREVAMWANVSITRQDNGEPRP